MIVGSVTPKDEFTLRVGSDILGVLCRLFYLLRGMTEGERLYILFRECCIIL